MPQFNDVEIIQLDGQPFAVSAMSAEIQELMALYNDWSRRAYDIQQELQMINMAREAMIQRVGQQYQAERQKAVAEAEAAAAGNVASPDPLAVAPDPEPVSTPEELPGASNE